ncbi:hypothetical protein BLS_009579 [Venturia inaequalis]|uniref:Uncharacterized protein n=1 Tax=Venturia inaequalis TaxID=5025 RepID=A0A8H3ZCM1_VENIN|nr:hypothetical protein BLS_009579 [Venturia inaequalis]KAE9991328.1 hypothetical protein EG327_011830 [Venturia inaequalis]RDI82013.1 hypothetical protein Vi05172_g7815 [Venturia inaequalis]
MQFSTILCAVLGLGATAFALPADAAVASGGTLKAATDRPYCERFRPGQRDYDDFLCARLGRCEHGDWRERGRDCARPRECDRRESDRDCGRWY